MASGEAEHYRKLAGEMRKRAAATKCPDIAAAMLEIAEEYERLAEYVSLWPPDNPNGG